MIYLDLLFNLTLLVALSIASGFIEKRWPQHSRSGILLQGILFGTGAVIGMMKPLNLGPGLIFDGRSVMISLCALFFGPLAAALASTLTIIYRIILGGAGTITGVLVILSSAGIGIIAHNRFKSTSQPHTSGVFYLFGILVHLAMIVMMFTLPGDLGWTVIKRIGFPVMILYPLVTVLVGKILSDQTLAIHAIEEQRAQRLIEARLALLEFATTHTLEELLTKALDETGALVNSPIGFYHFVEADQTTLSLQQWSTRTKKEFCQAEGHEMHYPIDQAGVWVDCVRQRKPVVHNDYASLSHKKGLPEGHAPVVRELVVPIFRNNAITAILGVGNKQTDYTAKDIETVSYMADVTWQIISKKRSDDALEESENLFRNIFENHSAVKLIIDPENGHILDANLAAENYYGWSKDQLKSMSIQDINLMPPEKIKQVIENIRNQKKNYFEVSHRLADGSFRDVEVFSSRITVKGKELLHSIIHDITDRKRVESMLHESETKYRSLFENAPIGIFATTSKGEALSVNNTMAGILGFTSPEETIAHYQDLQKKLYVSSAQRNQFIRMLKEKGHVENFEYQARTVDDKLIWLNMNARISNQEDNDTFVIEGFTKDITAQRNLEEQFRQAQKMESVGRLAGGVAHDYNNMLSVILGYTELALGKVNASDPIFDDLQEIFKASRRSMDITRQLLAFARKQTISPKIIDLNETIDGMLKMMRHLIGENIDLTWRPGVDLGAVKMDPAQIDQILANLFVNARDAISGIGQIIIETHKTTFDHAYCDSHPGFYPGEFILLAFSDNGCGMNKETLDKLFEPFFTTKGVGLGTGLGLATVYGIVKQNNGFINVYSEPGKGTTFKIYLQQHQGENLVHVKSLPKHIPLGQGETILIVEDEIAILNLSNTMLEKLGYRTLAANTAEEALNIAGEHGGKIHLLLTDVVMPGMKGRDLADTFHSLYPDIKILFMSGYTANVIEHQGILAEDVNFIQKPFSFKDLATKVFEVLNLE